MADAPALADTNELAGVGDIGGRGSQFWFGHGWLVVALGKAEDSSWVLLKGARECEVGAGEIPDPHKFGRRLVLRFAEGAVLYWPRSHLNHPCAAEGGTRRARPKETLMEDVCFDTWAARQGVERPFAALADMEPDVRVDFAKQLGVSLAQWRHKAAYCLVSGDVDVDGDDIPLTLKAEAEACIVINADRKGLQARSHSALRTINLFADDHNWRQVLESVCAEMKIGGVAEDASEVELESAIYEYLGAKLWETLGVDERGEIDEFLRDQPELGERLRSSGFGKFGTRMFAKGVFQAAKAGGFGTYINAAKAAAFLNKTLGTKIVMSTATHGLKIVLKGINAILWLWIAADVVNLVFGSSRERLLAPISQIHTEFLLMNLE
jgi:hypothetical protein